MELVQRYFCSSCHKSFSFRREVLRKRLTEKLKRSITHDYLCGLSLSDLSSKNNISVGSLWSIIDSFGANLKSDEEVAAELRLKERNKWSGILLLDGKVIKTHEGNFSLLLAFDFGTSDLISSVFGRYESEEALGKLVRQVKSCGYEIKFLVTDARQAMVNLTQLKACPRPFVLKGSRHYPRPFYGKPMEVFDPGYSKPLLFGVPHQLCVVHLLRDVDKVLKYPRTTDGERKKLRNILYRILLSRRYPSHLAGVRKLKERFPLTGKEHLRTADIVLSRLSMITTHFRFRKDNPAFKRKKIPNSTNPMENIISYLNQRLKTIRKFKTMESARRVVRLIIFKYRFRKLNGAKNVKRRKKSPLERAGAKIRGLNYLTFIQKSTA